MHPIAYGLELLYEWITESVARLEFFAKVEAFALLIP